MELKIRADISGLTKKVDVLNAIRKPFGIDGTPITGFDSFIDELRSLNTESPVWKEAVKNNPSLDAVRLEIVGAKMLRIAAPEIYKTLDECLVILRNQNDRHDRVAFTYEVSD